MEILSFQINFLLLFKYGFLHFPPEQTLIECIS